MPFLLSPLSFLFSLERIVFVRVVYGGELQGSYKGTDGKVISRVAVRGVERMERRGSD